MHIYHFCAAYFGNDRTSYFDGMVRFSQQIRTADDYAGLKQFISEYTDEDGHQLAPKGKTINVLSLTYLGKEEGNEQHD